MEIPLPIVMCYVLLGETGLIIIEQAGKAIAIDGKTIRGSNWYQ